jgi:hypothetical protein
MKIRKRGEGDFIKKTMNVSPPGGGKRRMYEKED